jgi:alanyl-tRNA synthetase
VTGHEIRRKFLDYFVAQDHREVRSSSLVPVGDPTLLFTNAGMNQFKDVFLGLEQRDYKRATSSQKCVRAGGKHNDLENVGRTTRHHTFFEMLGNFSFGDYFKKDAVAFAWELATSPKWFALPKDKLYATVFKGEGDIPRDDESEKSWLEQGVPKDRIFEFGMEDNFWQMGDTGPCGPCSEIHYDLGPAASDLGHKDCTLGCDCGRYVEIWNLVFMQFNRDASGAMTPLPKPCVDTGMGLERITTVLQGKLSNYDTDLFQPLIAFASELCGKAYGESKETDVSLRILADHSRAAAFLVSDGVLPSNEGRGYVLRKIIRRAGRHGHMLGLEKPFLHEMAGRAADLMRQPYPELLEAIGRVGIVIKHEEERFAHTLDVGLKKLDEKINEILPPMGWLQDDSGTSQAIRAQHQEVANQQLRAALAQTGVRGVFPGSAAFELYDTFGLQVDFIADVLRDRGLKLDEAGFEKAMEEQRTRARASWKGVHKEAASPVYAKLAETFRTEPDFYYETNARDCRIEAIVTKAGAVNEIKPGTQAEVVLDRTPIYAESGGQVADTGAFYDNAESLQVAQVEGAYYPVQGLIAHRIVAKETLAVGDRVAAVADGARREHIKRNHTATHLMHAALRSILGTHVKQSGSLVAPDHLRFDFTHFTSVDADELREIEEQVNEQVLHNAEILTDVTSLDEALASGALAFFGDKYPEQNVRVVTIPDAAAPRGFYSKELCGGTHVRRSGDIGVFKIIAEQSVAAGVRRVEAITGARALAEYQRALATLRQLAGMLNVGEDALPAAVERLTQSARQLERQLDVAKHKAAHSRVDDLMANVRTIKGVRVLAAEVAEMDREAMRQLVDTLRQKLGSGVVVLGGAEDGKAAIIGGVTKDLTNRLHAGKIVQAIAKEIGGSGGGRPDLAEAGGKDTSALKTAMERVYGVVEQML